ncbi:BPSL0067 family protein [Massilia sp. YIM B04103]|uniref:BPSL0067 family protein n=1 Tax=Massilia sp. YIM B04103 TaxID=2963106 RepID=UPI00210E5940|nr:BPSL0067 family protein [Massilia sp. YIM B04103]
MAYTATGKFTSQKEVVGNGQCVTLVKKLTGAPASSLWKEGNSIWSLIAAGKTIPSGTAIATFFNGRYPNYSTGNHAAIFLRVVANGIEVFDQWTTVKPAKRTIRFGLSKTINAVRRAESYSVVL